MSDFFVTTKVHTAACRRCSALTLEGIAGGVPARVDAAEITPAAARLYRLARFRVLDLVRGELRDIGRDFDAPGPAGGQLVLEHRCPGAIPAKFRAPILPEPLRPIFDGEFPF